MAQDRQTSCDVCKESGICKKKSGLPIFLTRYGIAPKLGPEKGYYPEQGAAYHIKDKGDHKILRNISESNAPEISGNFVKPPIPLDERCTYYTLRTLRQGYLYIYDERDEWQAYYITAKGFLDPLQGPYYDPTKKKPEHDPQKAPCQSQNYAEASYITIRNPDEAKNIWITLSDVEWTKDVWERYKDADYRDKHMRKFHVGNWINNNTLGEHAGEIEEIEKHVADFFEGINEDAFYFSPSASENSAFPFIAGAGGIYWNTGKLYMSRQEFNRCDPKLKERILQSPQRTHVRAASPIIDVSKRILPGKGIFIALDDPVGITRELAELMGHRIQAFSFQPRYLRKFVASTNIGEARKYVLSMAEASVKKAWEKIERYRIGRLRYAEDAKSGIAPLSLNSERGKYGPSLEDMMSDPEVMALMKVLDKDQKMTDPTPEKIFDKRVEEKDKELWRKHEYDGDRLRFSEAKREKFHKEDYPEAIKPYMKDIIDPISEAHAKWLESKELANCFISNFSTVYPEQGAEYPNILSLCIGDTQDKKASAKVLADWMGGKATEHENLLLRAVVFNQDALAKCFVAHPEELEKVLKKWRNQFTDLAKPSTTAEEIKQDEQPVTDTLLKKVVGFLKDFAEVWEATNDSSQPVLSRISSEQVNPSIEKIIAQVSNVVVDKLNAGQKDAIAPYLSAINIHDQSHEIKLSMRGTPHQYYELIERSVNVTEKDRLNFKPQFRYLANPRQIPITVRQTIGVEGMVALSKTLPKLISDGVITHGDIKVILQTSLGNLTVTPDSLGNLDDLLNARSLPAYLRVLQQVKNGYAFQPHVIRAEQAVLEHRGRLNEQRLNRANSGAYIGFDPFSESVGKFNRFIDDQAKAYSDTEVHRKELQKFRKNYQLDHVKRSAGVGNIYAGIGQITSVLALGSAWGQLDAAKAWGTEWQAYGRFSGHVANTIGATSESILRVLNGMKHIESTRKFAVAVRIPTATKLRWASKWFTILGAVFGAGADILDAYKERQKGNKFLERAYFASAVLAIAAAGFLLFNPASIVAYVVLGATIVVTTVLSALKDSKLQEYLLFCAFGEKDQGWTADVENETYNDSVVIEKEAHENDVAVAQ